MQAESIRLGDAAGTAWSDIWLVVDPEQYLHIMKAELAVLISPIQPTSKNMVRTH